MTSPVYDLRVKGTSLKGNVRITVPVASAGSSAPDAALLAFYDDQAKRWQPVNASYDPATHELTASSPHLSVWSAIGIDPAQILTAMKNGLAGFLGLTTAAPPSCSRTAQLASLGIKVTSDPHDLVEWCADADGTGAVVRVVNNRGYPIEMDYPSTWTMSRTGTLDPVTAAILAWLPALSLRVGGPNVRTAIIPSGQGIDVTQQPGVSAALLASPSAEGLIVDALHYAVRTLAMTYGDIPGVPAANPAATAKVVTLMLGDAACAAKLAAVVKNPDVSTAQAAGSIFRSLTDIAAGCLADYWSKAYNLPFLSLAAFVTSALLWAADSLNLVLGDARALIDSALYWQGYHIYVRSSGPKPAIPDIYIHNGFELGSLDKYPKYPAAIGLDNVDSLTGLQWVHMTPTVATANGVLNYNSCVPACAAGHYVHYSVELTASDPTHCTVAVYAPHSDVSSRVPAYVFNKLRLTAVSGNPPAEFMGSIAALPPACPAASGPPPAAACPTSGQLLAAWNGASAAAQQSWAAPMTVSGFAGIGCWNGWVVAVPVSSTPGNGTFVFSENGSLHLFPVVDLSEFRSAVCASSTAPASWRSEDLAACQS